MSDAKEKDKTNLIPLANQGLAIRASNLVRRGLEYLRAKEVTPLPVLTEDAAETVSSFNKDEWMQAGEAAMSHQLQQMMDRAPKIPTAEMDQIRAQNRQIAQATPNGPGRNLQTGNVTENAAPSEQVASESVTKVAPVNHLANNHDDLFENVDNYESAAQINSPIVIQGESPTMQSNIQSTESSAITSKQREIVLEIVNQVQKESLSRQFAQGGRQTRREADEASVSARQTESDA